MKLLQSIAGAAAILAVLCGPARAAPEGEVTVFAAASTSLALAEIAEAWKAAGHGHLRAVFASSGVLARQIDNGAPADLYLSANEGWMRWLAERGALDGEPVTLFGNRLVLVQPADAPVLVLDDTLPAALAGQRLAIGDPDHVPAGIYARQALESLGLWQALSPLTVRMKDVRAALLLVQRGEVAAGIVYESDTRDDARVRIAARFPDDSHEPIRFAAAVLADGNRESARRLLDFLRGSEAGEVFRRHGFRLE